MVDYSKPVTKRCTQEILNQMNTIFYEINQNFGFFCNTKFKGEKITVLIINNYINDEDVRTLNDVSINNEKLEIEKIIYKNWEYNISIIKIKNKNDNFNFIEIDDKLYENDSEIYYDKESIYIL